MKKAGKRESNSLTEEELLSLHITDDIYFASSLVFADHLRYATPDSILGRTNLGSNDEAKWQTGRLLKYLSLRKH